MSTVALTTPAKLNLGLRITGVREDGYHLIESVFAPIELHDRVEVELVPGPTQIELEVVEASVPALPAALADVTAGPDNLAYRAAEAFCKATGLEARIRIRLEKTIPAAAGMGGGSSDAAAVLRALAELVDGGAGGLRGPADPPDLAAVALDLGADVPFFLSPRPALVRGIGEIITPLAGLPSADLVIANPGISLDTAAVYRAVDVLGGALTDPRPGSTMRAFLRLCPPNGDPGGDSSSPGGGSSVEAARPVGHGIDARWAALLENDLEPAARRLCPPIGRLVAALHEAGALGAGMTGSGATVFGVFATQGEAARVAAALRDAENEQSEGSGREAAGKPRVDPAWVQVSRLMGEDG